MSTPPPPIIPFLGPPILAFLSAIVRGLTGFGDGITFQALWSIASSLNLLPSLDNSDTMRHAVLFSTLMQCVSVPIQVWQSRNALRAIAGYSIFMAVFGSLGVVVGALVLLSGEPSAIRKAVGALFYLFSVFSLCGKGRAALKKRHGDSSLAAGIADDAGATKSTTAATAINDDVELRGLLSVVPETTTAATAETISSSASQAEIMPHSSGTALELSSSSSSAWVPPSVFLAARAASASSTNNNSTIAAAGSTGTGNESSSVSFWAKPLPFPLIFTALSPIVSPRPMLFLLLLGSVFSGFLGGLFGAGGPPLMLVYAHLNLNKDVLRGFCIAPSFFVLTRLIMYITAPGSVMKMSSSSSSSSDDGGGGGNTSSDLALYATICGTSLVGVLVGSAGRTYIDSELLTILILIIVYVSSALMLHIDAHGDIVALFSCTAILGLCFFLFLWKNSKLWRKICGKR